jgi:hypothetical protein
MGETISEIFFRTSIIRHAVEGNPIAAGGKRKSIKSMSQNTLFWSQPDILHNQFASHLCSVIISLNSNQSH